MHVKTSAPAGGCNNPSYPEENGTLGLAGRCHPRDLLFQDDLAALCKTAGIPVLTPHKLRHAAKTLLTAEGLDPHVVQSRWAGGRTWRLWAYTGSGRIGTRSSGKPLGQFTCSVTAAIASSG